MSIYELLENILIHQADSPEQIVLAQGVCRRWKDVIQTWTWLQVPDDRKRVRRDPYHERRWRLNPTPQEFLAPALFTVNPIFRTLGLSIEKPQTDPGSGEREIDDDSVTFHMMDRIYDKPGSWTTMPATDPPCRWMEMTEYSKYSDDDEGMQVGAFITRENKTVRIFRLTFGDSGTISWNP